MKRRHLLSALALGTAAALALTGCASAENGDGDAAPSKDLTIGVFNGWPEGEAVSYIWKLALEEQGYNVTLEHADAGPVFAGVARGDYDFALDGWLPLTHADYFTQYGDKIVDLGSWNDDAKLTIAVNEDAPVDSLADLAANADAFGGRLIGIEPGAGLTAATEDNVIPTYGLEGMDFITSSTPAMLAELSKALGKGENIAVTLWRPHWAYNAYDIRDLADPEGTLGDAESIHTFTRTGFAEDYPEVNAWLDGFTMESDLLFSLEDVMYNHDGEVTDYTEIVKTWMAENQSWVEALTS